MFESPSPFTPKVREFISMRTPKTNESGKSKNQRWLQQSRSKKRHSNTNNESNLVSGNESINIDVNIQDVTLKRSLTKKNFFKRKKIKC